MDDSDARERHLRVRRCGRPIERRNATADDKCNIMLAEFLRARSLQQQKSAQETSKIGDVIQTRVVHFLPDDLLFKIFILLPAESLSRIQYVCKTWYSLINSSIFISYHAQQTETVLICLKLALSPQQFHEKPKQYFHFLDFDNRRNYFVQSTVTDTFRILTSCDGLALAKTEENKSLILVNPVTRKHVELPLGAIPSSPNESYNLSFCNEAKTYKVVHLFYQSQLDIGCEILSISERTWKKTDGFSSEFLPDIWQKAISLSGSLYWMSQKYGCDYFVIMNVQKEKFITKKLPKVCNVNDRMVEIGGALGLVTHETRSLMHVWILDLSSDVWIKWYDINLKFGFGYSAVPICSTRNGKDVVFAVFPGGHHLYSYEFDNSEMKLMYSVDDVEIMNRSLERSYIPHRNTLASWEVNHSPY